MKRCAAVCRHDLRVVSAGCFTVGAEVHRRGVGSSPARQLELCARRHSRRTRQVTVGVPRACRRKPEWSSLQVMKLVLTFFVLFVGCKGTPTDIVAAPSASPATSASSASTGVSTNATASSPSATTLTPPPDAAPAVTTVASVVPPRSKCVCPNVHVGGSYPQRSGHASPLPASEAQVVIAIDMAACMVKVRDSSGSQHVESCSSPLFAPPYINPAG